MEWGSVVCRGRLHNHFLLLLECKLEADLLGSVGFSSGFFLLDAVSFELWIRHLLVPSKHVTVAVGFSMLNLVELFLGGGFFHVLLKAQLFRFLALVR